MRFGELIGRAGKSLRDLYSEKPETLFSVKTMSKGELLAIHERGSEIFDLIKPISLEYQHLLLEKFFKNPNMTPGDIKAYYDNQFNFIMTAVSAELKQRPSK